MPNIYEITELIVTRRGDPVAAFVGDINLPEQYLPSELETFWKGLKDLDPTGHYNGCIWFKSGSYAYIDKDGEGYYWNYVQVPEIPKELC